MAPFRSTSADTKSTSSSTPATTSSKAPTRQSTGSTLASAAPSAPVFATPREKKTEVRKADGKVGESGFSFHQSKSVSTTAQDRFLDSAVLWLSHCFESDLSLCETKHGCLINLRIRAAVGLFPRVSCPIIVSTLIWKWTEASLDFRLFWVDTRD